MRPITKTVLAIAMGMIVPATGMAKIYMCVDQKTGATVYTNKRSKGCKVENVEKVGAYSVRMGSRGPLNPPGYASSTSSSSRSYSSGGGARGTGDQIVSQNVQQKRDETRRSILENELKNEEKALEQAQKNLAESRKVQPGETETQRKERIQRMEGAVLDRQENIKALRQEISRL